MSFNDEEGITRCIYIDIYKGEERKDECPDDCDLALVTSGSYEHSMFTPFIINAGYKSNRQIVCSEEMGIFYNMFRKVNEKYIFKL